MDDLKLQELLPDELRRYMTATDERRYLLVDVRQPAEYAAVHIPGAVLMPLMAFETRLFDLPPDRELVFYCRTGARSQVAAMLAAEAELSDEKIYNLIGGILAWEGHKLSDFPRIQVFQASAPTRDGLLTAMDLEKGAYRYYHQIIKNHGEAAFAPAIQKLAQAEESHARLIYTFWKQTQSDPPAFDHLFQELGGDILESGEPLEDAVARLAAAGSDPCLDFLELSLEIEYRAYDLYRNMAESAPNSEQANTFLTIAQAEKKHMQLLSRALAQCR
jgi:rhodanese-related sulfurtransferase/rubrerythrin